MKLLFIVAASLLLAGCAVPRFIDIPAEQLGASSAELKLVIPSNFSDYKSTLMFHYSVTVELFHQRAGCPIFTAQRYRSTAKLAEAVLTSDSTEQVARIPAEEPLFLHTEYFELGYHANKKCANVIKFFPQSGKQYVVKYFPPKGDQSMSCTTILREVTELGELVEVDSSEHGLLIDGSFGNNLCEGERAPLVPHDSDFGHR